MIDKTNVEAVYPLTPMQQGMIFHCMQAPGSGYYILQGRCVLKGELDVANFRKAWQAIIDRHAVLRTAFATGKKMAQVALRKVEVPLREEDWREVPETRHEELMQGYQQQDRERGFDFSEAPLMRLLLIRASEDTYYFLCSYHHALLDGWSLAILLKELGHYYATYSRGENKQVEQVRPFRDYIAWLQRQDSSSAETFWRRMLAGFDTPTPLPEVDLKRTEEECYERRYKTKAVEKALTAALHDSTMGKCCVSRYLGTMTISTR